MELLRYCFFNSIKKKVNSGKIERVTTITTYQQEKFYQQFKKKKNMGKGNISGNKCH